MTAGENFSEEEFQEFMLNGWNAFADFYNHKVIHYYAPVYQALLEMALPGTAERILDLGCGPGMPTFALAEQTGAEGSVLGIDISPQMVALARDNAAKRNINNVEFQVMDMKALNLTPGTFDLATSSFSAFLFPENFEHICSVLKPGGRFVFSAWGSKDDMPAYALAFEEFARFFPPTAPTMPDFFAMGIPDNIKKLLKDAGFPRVEVETFYYSYFFSDVNEYADYIWRSLGWVMPPPVQNYESEIKTRIANKATAYFQENQVKIPSSATLAIGYKAR